MLRSEVNVNNKKEQAVVKNLALSNLKSGLVLEPRGVVIYLDDYRKAKKQNTRRGAKK